jgi:hypothetical protein
MHQTEAAQASGDLRPFLIPRGCAQPSDVDNWLKWIFARPFLSVAADSMDSGGGGGCRNLH